jgi:hypothetical protein
MAWEIHKVGLRATLDRRGEKINEPYWRSLGTNKSIGYRVIEKGVRGAWLAKHDKDGNKKQHSLDLDEKTTYKDAVKAAEKWFDDLDQGITDDPTVKQICEDYIKVLREKRKKPGTAYTAELTFKREVYNKPIANIRATALRSHHIQAWIDARV